MSRLPALVHAELRPDRQVLGDFLRLRHGQLELPHHVHDFHPAGELAGGPPVQQDVVQQIGAANRGGHARQQRRDAQQLAQLSQVLIVALQVAQQDDVVFVAAVRCARRETPRPAGPTRRPYGPGRSPR